MMFLWNGKKLQLGFCVIRTSCLKPVFLLKERAASHNFGLPADKLEESRLGCYPSRRSPGPGICWLLFRDWKAHRKRLYSSSSSQTSTSRHPDGLTNPGSGRVAGTLRDPLDPAKGCKKEAPLTLLAGSIRRSARTPTKMLLFDSSSHETDAQVRG